MKGKRWILFFILLTASLLTAVLYIMPLTPSAASALSTIFVTNQGQDSGETHVLDQDQSKQLINALQGTTENELPEDLEAAYDMTLHLKGFFPRHYQVFVTSSRDVYLRRSISSRLIRSKDASFFYSHEAFHSLYIFGQMPDLRIVAQDEEIFPQVRKRQWQFLRWDNQWSDGRLLPLSEPSEKWPALKSAENDLTFTVDPVPDRIFLHVTDPTGKTVFEDTLPGGQLPGFHHNGLYDYRLSLFWEDETQPYRGQYEAYFSVKIELPPVFELPGPSIVQGELVAFYAHRIPEGVMPVLELDIDYRLQFFPHEDGYVAYLPTHYGTTPGEYLLIYGLEGEPLKESTLIVLPRDFHIQHLSVTPGIAASTQNEAAYEQFARYFPKARETSADERYYNQPFVLPVSGRLTTEFGETRYVNNAPTSSRHSGLDIAAPTGTQIVATNNGRVTLAMDLILTGNTIVIDHGQGLFSVYFHMHELFTEEGQLVERGETVGTVGSTGFSTGPHLHFTMSYYQHNLEPGYFLVGEPITYENARRHLRVQ
ncbi:MAG: M23 family metallopeptidase [Bacillota bacterium]|nr:M23 family metallopeptidase [Bacillota bacterium]